MTTANKATATPAPWKVAHSGYANSPFVIYAGQKAPDFARRFPLSGIHAIAEVFHDEGPDHEQQRCDANLIALAPELLALVKKFVAQTENCCLSDNESGDAMPICRDEAKSLIEKVEGR